MKRLSKSELIETLNELDHQTLAHVVFLRCFNEAVKSEELAGFKRSSLFRMALAYFLLVPDARAKFLAELGAHQA